MPSHLPAQSLYAMHNEFGLVKIGRSIAPEHRRQALAGIAIDRTPGKPGTFSHENR
jgi:hypothetical protein